MNPSRKSTRQKCIIGLRTVLSAAFQKAYYFVIGNPKSDEEMSTKNAGDAKELSERKIISHYASRTLSSAAEVIDKDCSSNLSLAHPDADASQIHCQFMVLPMPVREWIYYLLSPGDVLSLRLACRELKTDVGLYRGVIFKLHDGRLDCDQLLQSLEIEKLIVEQFTQPHSNSTAFFPYPRLLKMLKITGPISSVNFKLIMNSCCCSLMSLEFVFHLPDQQIFSSDLQSTVLNSMKVLSISSLSFGTTESRLVANSIKDILCEIRCPHLTTFKLHIVGFIPARIQEYHVWAQTLLSNHSKSLKTVEIHLKQLMHPFMVVDNMENLQIINEWTNLLHMEQLQLSINSHAQLWYPIIDTQSCLETLNLDVRNQSWTRLILVLDKSAKTLRKLAVTGLCLTLADGIRTMPVDFNVLERLEKLEILEMQHLDMEVRGMSSPQVLRTSLLPRTLKFVKLSNLFLKPHQVLFLLLKLLEIEKLDLECWTDSSEESLAAILTVLTFLIKFDQTPVKTILLTESRRRMENRLVEIQTMKNALCNQAKIFQEYSELHSTITINRFI